MTLTNILLKTSKDFNIQLSGVISLKEEKSLYVLANFLVIKSQGSNFINCSEFICCH